ncbi:hypothetical protein MASR1M36_08280 [Candidatus Cloacimonadaceae bacterium]
MLTEGSLAFSVRTATYNGPYAPRNAGVIWITNSQNQFVKTIKIWAATYRYTLIRWISSSGQNTQGAITGASLNNHQLHNVAWNGTDAQGNPVPDGDYKMNVEFTEHNATAGNMGKFKQITFTKGSEPVNLTIPNEQYFRDMTLSWTPIIQNGTISGIVSGTNNVPLSDAVIAAGANSVFSNADGSYSISLQPGTWDVSCMIEGYVPQTITGVEVLAAQNTTLNFNLNAVSSSDEHLIPSTFLLSQPSPNPFKSTTTLKLNAGSGQKVQASVYDLKGRRICSLPVEGARQVQWNGLDSHGKACVNGTYIIKVESGKQCESRKVILLK